MNNDVDCESVKQTRAIDPSTAYFNNIDRTKCKKKKKLITLIIIIIAVILAIMITTHVIDFIN